MRDKMKSMARKFISVRRGQIMQEVVARKFIRVRERNQITLPSEVISGLPIHPGDFLEISQTAAGLILLKPTALVTVGSSEAIHQESLANDDISKHRYGAFNSAAELMADLKNRRISKVKVAEEKAARVT